MDTISCYSYLYCIFFRLCSFIEVNTCHTVGYYLDTAVNIFRCTHSYKHEYKSFIIILSNNLKLGCYFFNKYFTMQV